MTEDFDKWGESAVSEIEGMDVISRSHGWTIAVDGVVHGLVAGDMGYDATHIVIPQDHLLAMGEYMVRENIRPSSVTHEVHVIPKADIPATDVIEDRVDWLVDAIAVSTQDRRFLRGEPEADTVAIEAILLNARQAMKQVAYHAFSAAKLHALTRMTEDEDENPEANDFA